MTETREDTGVLADEASNIRVLIGDDIWQGFNEWQLWYIFLALDGITLVEPLKSATTQLSQQVLSYGNARFGWDILEEDYAVHTTRKTPRTISPD